MMRSMPSSRPFPCRPTCIADRLAAFAGAPRVGVARLLPVLAVLAVALVARDARALSFQADFVSSNYQTLATDTFSSLMLRHQAGTQIRSSTTTGLENISTAVYANGVNSNYSLLMTTTFQAAVAGTYTFQVGTDWGRGGAAGVLDATTGAVLSQRVITGNVWWANDWNNASVFTTSATLAVGQSVTFGWVGFEDCCGGTSTVRFSVNGSGYQNLNQTNFQSFTMVPEPSSALLMGLGLLGLAVAGGRPRR